MKSPLRKTLLSLLASALFITPLSAKDDRITEEDLEESFICESSLVDELESAASEIYDVDYLYDYQGKLFEKEEVDYNIKKPDIKARIDGELYEYAEGTLYDYEGSDAKFLSRLLAVEDAYYTHMRQLLDLGVNIDDLEDFQIILDTDDETLTTGGYYYYDGLHYTLDGTVYDKNTIMLYYPENVSSFKLDLTNTFIHEFGHHIGFSNIHKDKDFTLFNEIRDGRVYKSNNHFLWYDPEWRNDPVEQFAESYMELFITDYFNVSSAPLLTEKEKSKFIKILQDNL